MKELINNLEELNRKAEKGGGDARIEKQHWNYEEYKQYRCRRISGQSLYRLHSKARQYLRSA